MTFYTANGAPISAAAKREMLRQMATEMLRAAKPAKSETTRDLMKARRKVGKLKERLRGKQKSAEKLAALLAPPATAQGVYVIGIEGGAVKIGIAKDAKSRMGEIQTGCPDRLTLFCFFPAPDGHARSIEKECHRRLAASRKNGEWFDLDWRDASAMVRIVLNEKIAEIGSDLESRWD